jgi:hypothetical protein
MPLRHHGAKVHKELLTNTLNFVKLGGFVSWWQKKEFLEGALVYEI